MKLIAQADVVLALGSRLGPVRHAAAARPRLLAEERQDHPDRRRPQDARAWSRRSRVGICGDAKAAARRAHRSASTGKHARLRRHARPSAPRKIDAEKAAWEKELDEWTHEKDPYSLDMIEEQKTSAVGGN